MVVTWVLNPGLALIMLLWTHPESYILPCPPLPAPPGLQVVPLPTHLGEFLSVGEVVHGDGQEDIQQSVWLAPAKEGNPSAPHQSPTVVLHLLPGRTGFPISPDPWLVQTPQVPSFPLPSDTD